MTTPETLNENNDSLYEGLDLPSEGFSFGVDVPDGDPDKDVESVEKKMKAIKEFIEKSPLLQEEKEELISIVDSIDDKDTINNLYNTILKHKLSIFSGDTEEVKKFAEEVAYETSKYVLSEPEKMAEFVKKLHLPMDKKDILASMILSTALPMVGIALPVDPITANTLYNSGEILKELDKKVKEDTTFARKMASKITNKVVDRLF